MDKNAGSYLYPIVNMDGIMQELRNRAAELEAQVAKKVKLTSCEGNRIENRVLELDIATDRALVDYLNNYELYVVGSLGGIDREISDARCTVASLNRVHPEFAKTKLPDFLSVVTDTLAMDTNDPLIAKRFARNHENLMRALDLLTTSNNPADHYEEILIKLLEAVNEEEDVLEHYWDEKIAEFEREDDPITTNVDRQCCHHIVLNDSLARVTEEMREFKERLKHFYARLKALGFEPSHEQNDQQNKNQGGGLGKDDDDQDEMMQLVLAEQLKAQYGVPDWTFKQSCPDVKN